jgi:Spy/CpxP family protein refolding chaperone
VIGNRRRAAFVIAAIVVGSALAGAGIDHVLTPRARRPRGALSGLATPQEAARHRAELLEQMGKELDLSAAQRAGIDSVMQRSDSALRDVRREMEPRLRKVLDASRTEIMARLDSTQRIKFQKLRPPRRRF